MFNELTRVESSYFINFFIRLSWFVDPDYEFGRLTRVVFYVIFLISSFNIELVRD